MPLFDPVRHHMGQGLPQQVSSGEDHREKLGKSFLKLLAQLWK